MTQLKRSAGLAVFAVVLAIVASSGSAQAQEDEGEEISVRVGEQTSLSAEGVRSYSEGARGIADVRLTRDQTRFIIVGQRAGATSLLLIMSDGTQVQYRITVVGEDEEEDTSGRVAVRENIRLDLYFVSISDTYSHAIGVAFPSVVGATASTASALTLGTTGALGGPYTTAISIVGETFLPRLDIAQSSGWARLYRQAALITANGTEASFNAGGEFNVITQNTLQTTLVKLAFGTNITCRPRYDAESGRVELRITADVSDLTAPNDAGVPGRTVSTVETLVNLELGQSIVLAGFVSRSEQRARTGLPGLSQIPVLGALFGTHSRRYEESEGLMFIVPSVVDAVPLTQRNRIEEAMRIYEDFSGGVDEVEVLDQPRVRQGQ